MKVLVVEDERWARKDLVRAIQQLADSLTSFSVREAANGEEAWKLIVSEKPDLLITDIRMPRMDGLELIAKAKAQNPLLLCMIVSGYDEFEYARQGIKYGVKQYLLKPVQEAELASALAEAVADLQARKRTEREESRHSLYRWLLSPASSPAPELRELRGPIAMLTIQSGNRRTSCEGTALSGQPGFPEADAADCISCRPPDQSNLLVLIRPLPSIGSAQETKRLMMAWAQEWLDRLPIPMAHAAYEQVESAALLPEAYRRITERMHQALQLEKKQIIHPERQPSPPPDLHEIWSLVRVVGHAVQNGSIREVEEKWDALHRNLIRANLPFGHLRTLLIDILVSLSFRRDEISFIKPIDLQEKQDKLDAVISYGELNSLFLSWLLELQCDQVDLLEQKNAKQLLLHIVKHMETRYAENIKLKEVAEKHGIHPSHLSRLFKEEYGVNFSDFLSGLRFDKAKRLLLETSLKPSEIASLVGFEDAKYFGTWFVKMTGMSPSAFRKQ